MTSQSKSWRTARPYPSAASEQLRRRGDDLLVRHVPDVLGHVPAVAERIVELTVTVAPEGVTERLPDGCAGRDRGGEDGVRVADVERQHDRGAADRWRRQDPELRKLVGEMHGPAREAQGDRHQAPVGRGDPAGLLGPEGLAVEGGGALGALDDEVWRDRHAHTVSAPS